jgi:excisionase family DNA binding protein
MSDEKRIEELPVLGREAKPSLERVVVRPADVRASDVRSGEARSDRPTDAPKTAREGEALHTREPRHRVAQPDILNIDEAAELLGVSIKTFNKVLHHQNMPARKIGREWKFSRQALIDWVGSGRSQDFYRESGDDDEEEAQVGIKPQSNAPGERAKSRRTAGWQIELD